MLLDPGIAVAEAPLRGEPPDLSADGALSIVSSGLVTAASALNPTPSHSPLGRPGVSAVGSGNPVGDGPVALGADSAG